jgi:uncharacterized protein involved in exopolysaccharide biosynthesis
MRIVAFIFLGVCLPMAGFSQGQPSQGQPLSVCDTIKQLHGRYAEARQQLAQLQRRYTETHPDVVATYERLASLEGTLAAEKARAASQGLDCY